MTLKKGLLLVAVFAIGFFGTKFVLKSTKKSDEPAMSISTAQMEKMPTPDSSWQTLFDGSSYQNWHGYLKDSVSNEWTIEDKAMVFTPAPNREKSGSDIVSNQTFTNFILSLEWRISEGGNSGIFWGVQEDEQFAVPYLTGPEIQVLDDDKHPDRVHENHRAGSLYDMIKPSKKVLKPVGDWNTCVIKIDHEQNKGKVWLNDILIVEFPVNGPKWDAMVKKSKFKNWEHFGVNKTGRIGLQDHADVVSYRNIYIKPL